MTRPTGKVILLAVTSAVVLGTVIGGLMVLGPPEEERTRRLDDRRVDDLTRISINIDQRWGRLKNLPASLDDIARQTGDAVSVRDPRTNEPYEYHAGQGMSYELCATFQRDSGLTSTGAPAEFWTHGTGRQCFALTVREPSR